MANAWAFSALPAGSAIIAKLLAMGFVAFAELPESVASAAARLIIGVVDGIGSSHSPKRRNHFPGSREIVLQLNSKTGRWAIADPGFTTPYIFGATGC
jgi:hypothetical protein